MHLIVSLCVSAAFLMAGCGGATGSGATGSGATGSASLAFSDAAVSFARSTPVPAAEVAPKSECVAAAECQRACEAGQVQSCTRWGDLLYAGEPDRAESVWLAACQRRDGLACLRMMALAASEPRTADAYARHACAYGAVNACELLGTILTLRGLAGKGEHRPAFLRDAARVFEMGCSLGHWQSCLSAGHAHKHEELASPPGLRDRFYTRAWELVTGACKAGDTDACLFRGGMLEEANKLEDAKNTYAHGCRKFLELASTIPYTDAIQMPACHRASELGVAPPPASIERNESSGPAHVATIAVEARRIAGERTILPSVPIRVTMLELGRHSIDASTLMCLSSSGLVESLRLTESSEFAAYDLALLETMRTWRYSPHVENGTPKAVCTMVTFVYHQVN